MLWTHQSLYELYRNGILSNMADDSPFDIVLSNTARMTFLGSNLGSFAFSAILLALSKTLKGPFAT